MLNFVKKEDVIRLFDELLPWEKIEVLDKLQLKLDISIEEVLDYYSYNPVDLVTPKECVNEFCADELMSEMGDDEIGEYVEWHDIPSHYLIDGLTRREINQFNFTEADIQELIDFGKKCEEAIKPFKDKEVKNK